MTTPGVSQPAYPGTTSRIAYMQVDVQACDYDRRVAMCRDQFGRTMEIRFDIMRAKGNLPAVGERWVVDQQYGFWTFGAIMNGSTAGVEIPPENVFGLPEALESQQDALDQTNATFQQLYQRRPTGTIEPTFLSPTIVPADATDGIPRLYSFPALRLDGGVWFTTPGTLGGVLAKWVRDNGLNANNRPFNIGPDPSGKEVITLPDYRGRFLIGASPSTDENNFFTVNVGQMKGAKWINLTEGQLPGHTHNVSDDGDHVHSNQNNTGSHTGHNDATGRSRAGSDDPWVAYGIASFSHSHPPTLGGGEHSHTVDGGGSGNFIDIRPESIGINFIIWC